MGTQITTSDLEASRIKRRYMALRGGDKHDNLGIQSTWTVGMVYPLGSFQSFWNFFKVSREKVVGMWDQK